MSVEPTFVDINNTALATLCVNRKRILSLFKQMETYTPLRRYAG